MLVRFYYDIVCPYAYLASLRVEAMARRTGATLEWCPVLLGGLYRTHGTLDVPGSAWAANKVQIGAADLLREAAANDAPFCPNPRHPQRSVTAMRLITAASGETRVALSKALYSAYWVDNQDINDPDVLGSIAQAHGLSLEHAARQDIKDALRANTAAAAERGAFGVPTFEVDTKIWWGQDRMHLVETALGGQSTFIPKPGQSNQKTISFFHDFSSPYSYLASTQIQALADDWGVQLELRPMLLGALFKAIGTANIPLFTFGQARMAYMMRDLVDWSEWWDIPFNFAPHFPMRTVTAGRVAIIDPSTTSAIYRAAWVDGVDLNDDMALAEALTRAGFDGPALVAATQDPAIKARLRENTETAIEAGGCGAPTILVGDQLFWGQDRLNRVAEALRA
jgi:2-hydroxychromene-2-carboxylate isomerase